MTSNDLEDKVYTIYCRLEMCTDPLDIDHMTFESLSQICKFPADNFDMHCALSVRIRHLCTQAYDTSPQDKLV